MVNGLGVLKFMKRLYLISMGKDPAFLFYPADASEDVSHMNRLERGCYFDFIQAQKKFGAMSLPVIKKILGTDFELCWPSLKMCLTYDKDMYFIFWLQESIEKRRKYSESRSRNKKGLSQPKIKEKVLTYDDHMGIETVIENGNINATEDLKIYKEWTDVILTTNDQFFNDLVFHERWKPIAIPVLDYWARDHLDLLHRYPKMRPQDQNAFRRSLLKHLRENKDKNINSKLNGKSNQRSADAVIQPGKDFGKFD